MTTRLVEHLRPGDAGIVSRQALVGDTRGNKYLRAYAEVDLETMPCPGDDDDMFVCVAPDNRVCVSFMGGVKIAVVPPPEEWEEGLVWIDELRQVD